MTAEYFEFNLVAGFKTIKRGRCLNRVGMLIAAVLRYSLATRLIAGLGPILALRF